MIPLIPPPDPLGLPVPLWILLALKVFGFFLHLIFMNLWVAGLPTALYLLRSKPAVAERLFHALPFFLAFGINAGIVPLLFLQTIYPQFFYPATILQAWFWFFIIPLLLVAYYAVYLASFGKFRIAGALTATILLFLIGLMFSSAMTLTANPQDWTSIFLGSNRGGATYGLHLHLDLEVFLRFSMVVGMAFGTLAAYLVLDAECFSTQALYKNAARSLVLLYLLGTLIYGAAGAMYAASVMQKLPDLWLGATGSAMIAGALLALAYWRNPTRAKGVALVVMQLVVLAANAIARQWVQFTELLKWFDPSKIPVRGEWGSLMLFLVSLIAAMLILAWITDVALRRGGGGAA
jgi:hypothetical protein